VSIYYAAIIVFKIGGEYGIYEEKRDIVVRELIDIMYGSGYSLRDISTGYNPVLKFERNNIIVIARIMNFEDTIELHLVVENYGLIRELNGILGKLYIRVKDAVKTSGEHED